MFGAVTFPENMEAPSSVTEKRVFSPFSMLNEVVQHSIDLFSEALALHKRINIIEKAIRHLQNA